MPMKTLQCRDHGGTFKVVAKRGRPPVRCATEHPCTRAGKKPVDTAQIMSKAMVADGKKVRRQSTLPREGSALRTSKWCKCDDQGGEPHEKGIEGCRYATRGAPVVVRHNPSIQFAGQTREMLEPLGWMLTGRAGFEPLGDGEEEDAAWAEVTATRGTESLFFRWVNGKIQAQVYSLWDSEKTAVGNGAPKSRLTFDPDQMSDAELVMAISGQPVTWWNRLGRNNEKAIVSKEKVNIQHNFTGGNESARMVTFVDISGGGFRSFHVDALLKVG